MPFYGRGWTLQTRYNTSVGAPSSGASRPGEFTRSPGTMAYYEVRLFSVEVNAITRDQMLTS